MKEIREGKIKTAILDMDGTIYQLDGDNNGFRNSTLHKTVNANATRFFSQREKLLPFEAENLIQRLHSQDISLSEYASEKYGITRREYFEATWNIDPSPIVVNYKEAVIIIKELASIGIELILITQAPQVWQNSVFNFIGLGGLFSDIYTAERYKNKSEIFSIIKQDRDPTTILAIGDQIETDIEQAAEQGLNTFHVNSPKDLLKLFDNE